MMKRIEVEIGPEGEVSIDAAGFTGPDCEEATRFLEEALGEVTERGRKPEYHRRGIRQQRQSLGNGGRRV